MSLNPRIDINVRTALSLIPSPGDAIGLLIGTAQYGRTDEILTYTNFTSVLSEFQEDYNQNTSIIKGAEAFFANNGSILKVIRIEDGTAEKANIEIDGESATSDVITVEALNKGAFGNNFMINIDVQGSGRIIRIRSGNNIELFNNDGDIDGYTTNQAMADAVNARSNLVNIIVNDNTKLVNNTASFIQLSGGANGSTNITSSHYTTAFDNIAENEDWDFLMIPNTKQTIELENTDAFHTLITGRIENRENTLKKYSMYISGVVQDEVIADIQARTTASERFVLCAPSIVNTSRVDGAKQILDGTYLGCALAGRLCELDDSGSSSTRKEVMVEDLMVNSTTNKKYYDNPEIDILLNSRVCIASRIANGLKYARGITRIADTTSIYFEINIVRIVDKIKTTIQNTLDDYLGEPNSTITRTRMEAVVDGILESSQNQGLLNEYLPTVVTTGASPDSVNVAIIIKPAFSTNFINVVITIN